MQVHYVSTCVSWHAGQPSTMKSASSSIMKFLPSCSPQVEKFKADRVGVVWAEFVTTSLILVTTSKKYGY